MEFSSRKLVNNNDARLLFKTNFEFNFIGNLWIQLRLLMKGESKNRQEKDLQTLKQVLENKSEKP